MTKKQKNYRLPEITIQNIESLKTKTGLTEVQIIILAIEYMVDKTRIGKNDRDNASRATGKNKG